MTGRIGDCNVALAFMAEMGKVWTAGAASSFLSSFPNIELGLIVGVCGAVPFPKKQKKKAAQINLGDLIISTGILQADFGWDLSDGFKLKDTIESSLGRLSRPTKNFMSKLESKLATERLHTDTSHNLLKLCYGKDGGQYLYPGTKYDKLYPVSYLHKHYSGDCDVCSKGKPAICDEARKASCGDIPCDEEICLRRRRLELLDPDEDLIPDFEIHFGRVASADQVMRNAVKRDALHSEHNVIAFEMEGAGAWDHFPTVVIKGVSDYADSHKGERWQKHAAAKAAACMKGFLLQWYSITASELNSLKISANDPESAREYERYTSAHATGFARDFGGRSSAHIPEPTIKLQNEQLLQTIPTGAPLGHHSRSKTPESSSFKPDVALKSESLRERKPASTNSEKIPAERSDSPEPSKLRSIPSWPVANPVSSSYYTKFTVTTLCLVFLVFSLLEFSTLKSRTISLSSLAVTLNSSIASLGLGAVLLGPEINPAYPIFAIIGRTGVGKSTFIKVLGGLNNTRQAPDVCHGLETCTNEIRLYKTTIDDSPIYLMDTPGFDDDRMSDPEVMEMIYNTIQTLYQGDKLVKGLIYLHEITQSRVGGLASRHFRAFEQLLGVDGFKNIVFVTNKWIQRPSEEDSQRELDREVELKSKYWKKMLDRGAQVMRHDGSANSAKLIIMSLNYMPRISLPLSSEEVQRTLHDLYGELLIEPKDDTVVDEGSGNPVPQWRVVLSKSMWTIIRLGFTTCLALLASVIIREHPLRTWKLNMDSVLGTIIILAVPTAVVAQVRRSPLLSGATLLLWLPIPFMWVGFYQTFLAKPPIRKPEQPMAKTVPPPTKVNQLSVQSDQTPTPPRKPIPKFEVFLLFAFTIWILYMTYSYFAYWPHTLEMYYF